MGVLRPVTQEPSSAVIEEIVDHQTDYENVNMVTILRRPDQPRLKIDLQGGLLGSIIPVSKRAVVIGQEATQILRWCYITKLRAVKPKVGPPNLIGGWKQEKDWLARAINISSPPCI